MNRRKVLQGLAGATAGSIGLAFGSGAFTTVEAEREFDIELAEDDAESQLVIEPNDDLPSSAVTTGDDGEFEIDGSNISPGSTTTFGFFATIDEPETLDQGVFIIRNENETGDEIDITVELDLDIGSDSTIHLALLTPDDDVFTASGSGEDSIEIDDAEGIPSAVDEGATETDEEAEVEVGFIVEAASLDGEEEEPVAEQTPELSADLTIEAERSGGD